MKRVLVPACLAVAAAIAPRPAMAQDVAITNARIIVGNGTVIESGTIIVRGGKIVVRGGRRGDRAGPAGDRRQGHERDARVHRRPQARQHRPEREGADAVAARGRLHDGSRRRRQADNNVMLRDHIESGMINGPRIIPSGQVNLRQTPAEARAAVQALAARGIKHTGEIGLTPEPAPPQAEIEVLKAIVDEAKKVGVQVNVHAVSSPAMVAAIDAGVTPAGAPPEQGLDELRAGGEGGADRVDRRRPDRVRRAEHRPPVAGARAGAVCRRTTRRASATASRGPRRSPARTATPKGRATGTEGGYTIINARRIWDADPNHHDDVVLHRSERRRSRGARARAEVVQHRVLDGGHPQDHRPQRRTVRRHGRSDRDARGGQARRHHPASTATRR